MQSINGNIMMAVPISGLLRRFEAFTVVKESCRGLLVSEAV